MMFKIFILIIFLELSFGLEFDELLVETEDGKQYDLNGYTSQNTLSTGFSNIFAAKIKKAVAFTLPSPAILKDLGNIEYAFLHLLFGLVTGDKVYSNIILEFLSSLERPPSSFISPLLLLKMKLTQKDIYLAAKKLARSSSEGLIDVPDYIQTEFHNLDKKYNIFNTACTEGDIDMVNWFLKSGYNLESNRNEIMKLTWNASQWEIIKILIENGILYFSTTPEMASWSNEINATLLHFAAEANSRTAPLSIFSLANGGFDLNVLDINGCSPLCRALNINSSITNVDALLLKGGNVNWRSPDLNNLLHIAVQNENMEVVKLLSSKGTLINERNSLGLSPLEYAEILGLSSIILILQEDSKLIKKINKTDSILWTLWLSPIFQKSLLTTEQKIMGIDYCCYNITDKLKKQSLIVEHLRGKGVNSENFKDEKVKLLELALLYRNNDSLVVNYLLKIMPFSVTSKEEQSILPIAASKGLTNLVKLFIEKGYNLNSKNSESKSSLFEAAFFGYSEIVRILIVGGADVNISTNEGLTPLHAAAEKGHADVVKTLLQHNADVNARSKNGQTPLHAGAKGGSTLVIDYLLQYNASIDAMDINNLTPVKMALDMGHVGIFRFLVDHGAFVKFTSDDSWSLLYAASENGEEGQVKELISKGIDVNAKNKDSWSILHQTIQLKQEAIAMLLIKGNADVNITNNDGFSVLHVAAKVASVLIVKELLKRGAFVNARSIEGWSVLHAGVEGKNVTVVEILLNNGANVNASNNDEWTPLHEAMASNQSEIIKLLIERGADTNAKNKDSWTVLHFAVEYNNLLMVKLLINGKADVNSKNREGWFVLQEAVASGRKEIAEFLLEKGANPNTANRDGWTVLHEASANGEAQIVRSLLSHSADVNKSLISGWSPLHSAAEHGHLEVVKILVENCADLQKKDDGQTPREVAVLKGHSEVATFLQEKESRYDVRLPIFNGTKDLLKLPNKNKSDKKKKKKKKSKKKN